MIHETPLLEYAGRDLAYLQWAAAARHWVVLVLAAQVFLPHPRDVWAAACAAAVGARGDVRRARACRDVAGQDARATGASPARCGRVGCATRCCRSRGRWVVNWCHGMAAGRPGARCRRGAASIDRGRSGDDAGAGARGHRAAPGRHRKRRRRWAGAGRARSRTRCLVLPRGGPQPGGATIASPCPTDGESRRGGGVDPDVDGVGTGLRAHLSPRRNGRFSLWSLPVWRVHRPGDPRCFRCLALCWSRTGWHWRRSSHRTPRLSSSSSA